MRAVPRHTSRDSNWGSNVAMSIATAVALVIVALLLMDMHLSYKHVHYVDKEIAANDHYVRNGLNNLRNKFDLISGSVHNISSNSFSKIRSSNTYQYKDVKDSSDIKVNKPKIAYIFAGSARSFVCPQVHWSIKANLIDALGGEPHSFVRMSLEDNKNVKTGTGIIFKPEFDEREINETLKILNPDIIERFSYTTQVEEMKRLFPQPIHTVFRENDQRRYSMFYHRCRAYELMLKYEKENNIKFDWVVLGRVDAGWLEPLLPIEAYDNDRVWITETGYDRFNDQFMLIPRQYSDYLYDLNTKVQKGVYCLGGPDVETWKCNTTALQQRGISDEKIQSVLPYCCPDILNKATNHIGRSERIHYKHLETGKIPIGIGRFPQFLTRRMPNGECVGECFRIYAYHYKEYVFRFDSAIYPYLMPPIWPDTRGRSISARDRNLCYALKEPVYPWKPISITSFHDIIHNYETSPLHTKLQTLINPKYHEDKLKKSTEYYVDYTKPLSDPSQRLHPSILLNPKDTEVWRIHPTWNTEGCLTFQYDTKQIAWENCKGHCMAKSNTYMPNQLFFLYVQPVKPRPAHYLSQRSYHSPSWFPDSTYNSVVRNITRVMMLNSEPVNIDYRKAMYCLTAEKLQQHAKITMQPCTIKSSTEIDIHQSFITVQGSSDGSHPQTTIGQLKFAGNPDLCVARSENKVVDRSIYPESDALYVSLCIWKAHYHKNIFEFELIGS